MLADLLIKKYDKFMQTYVLPDLIEGIEIFNKRNGRFHPKSSGKWL